MSGLRIAVVNNMPDAALKAAVRQFTTLAREAAPGEVEFRQFHLESTCREAPVAKWLKSVSRPLSELDLADVDAVLVTGAEPRAPRLEQEPYFAEFAAFADRAAEAGACVLWSCLAAHAAVLHLAGVERRLLDAKLSGVYPVERFADHELGAWLPHRFVMPHSRWNTLPVGAVIKAGGRLISGSAEIGACAFTLDAYPNFLFVQGHPEYEPDTLMREFRRDLARFVMGQSARRPSVPCGLLSAEEEGAIADQAGRLRPHDVEALAQLDAGLAGLSPKSTWSGAARALVGLWLTRAAARSPSDFTSRRKAG